MKYKMYKIADLIDEIAMGPFGSNIKVDCFVDEGIPVLNGSNLEGFALSEKSFRYVTNMKADSLKKANAYKGDVVITHRGTLGQIVYIPQNSKHDRYVISQSQFRVRCNEKILPEYMVYYFHTTFGQHKLLSNASQVGVPALARPSSTFQQIEIEVPSIQVQRHVVSIIEAIQSKINTNNTINDNLQQQAQVLYAEHFCLRDGDSIPDGWSLISLGDVAVISNKSFNPLKQPETMLEHYSIPAFDETRYPVFELSTSIKSNKFVVDVDCFMISKLNPTTKRVWRPYCMTNNAVCSTEFIVYKAKERELTEFLYSLIDSVPFSDFMCSHVTGSTGSRQRTIPTDTLQYQFYLPTAEEIAAFSAVVAPMYAQIRINAMENARLKALRDSLLPRLMSGEIDVSNIEI